MEKRMSSISARKVPMKPVGRPNYASLEMLSSVALRELRNSADPSSAKYHFPRTFKKVVDETFSEGRKEELLFGSALSPVSLQSFQKEDGCNLSISGAQDDDAVFPQSRRIVTGPVQQAPGQPDARYLFVGSPGSGASSEHASPSVSPMHGGTSPGTAEAIEMVRRMSIKTRGKSSKFCHICTFFCETVEFPLSLTSFQGITDANP